MRKEEVIPSHWKLKKLGEVAVYLNGRAFKPSEWEKTGKPIIRIQNLNKDSATYNYTNHQFEDKYKVEKGDLLYAWSASLGVFIWNGNTAWLNQHIFKVIPRDTSDKKFLFYFLEKITSEIYSKAHGSGMVHVTKGKFEATEIPFPPLPEQQVIVAKIEELLSELDNGKQQLQTAQQQLKVYRQSLLKWAFEGKLTNKDVEEGELPKGWKWVNPTDIASPEKYSIGIGPFGSNLKVSDYKPTGVPLIFVKNITRRNFSLVQKFISTEKFKELMPHSVKPLDILITKMGDPPGDCAIYPESSAEAVITSDCLKLTVNEKVANRKYIFYVLQTQMVKRQLELITKGVAQKKISLQRFRNIKIPLTTLEEQNLIVAELESKITVCDKIEETISQSLLQAETLRQSILKKAFEGRLINN
ncbi:restriction endonuclease subunit S [Aquiflexum sp. TKW24L]|uniref:restriction endonuclease subunit S n=1 Tax=Aquiflexum sp. TKW24L TaxID=2942212 RepID=UPI0020C037E8|nr:restriction endonuclease subunit S [Aquiflexum sp. TKW24L]MCL6261471.1 restriction endonuclease subunit S [Aquiflexum sp. TKW24L]